MVKGKPVIVIPIVRGHMARLLVYSGVINRLAEKGASVNLLTNADTVGSLRKYFENTNVTVEELPNIPLQIRIYYYWYKIYNYFFETFLPTESSAAKLNWIKHHDFVRYKILKTLSSGVLQVLRSFWLNVRRAILPAWLYRSVFENKNVDIVVVGSAARNPEEYFLLRYAINHKIRNICTLQSWDLLTTKGDLLERPDHLTVWNDANHQEAVTLFEYAPQDVLVVGAPQFDIYFETETYVDRATWCAKYGLNPAKKVILVTGGSANVHRNLPSIVCALIDGIKNNAFVEDIQILIRPHPAVYLGTVSGDGNEADLQEYESWHPSVKINRPQSSPLNIIADTAKEEHEVLANNLYHADILLDFYGTVSVEACLVDTPVIYADVQSDFSEEKIGTDPMINRNDYTHLRRVISTGGVRIVANRGELFNTINLYLAHPEKDAEGRYEIVKSFGYTGKGHSVSRMTRAIYEYGCGKWPPIESSV